MAAVCWQEKDVAGGNRKAKVAECEDWLNKVAKWESYVLDARIGMKVTTGLDTIRRFKA